MQLVPFKIPCIRENLDSKTILMDKYDPAFLGHIDQWRNKDISHITNKMNT